MKVHSKSSGNTLLDSFGCVYRGLAELNFDGEGFAVHFDPRAFVEVILEESHVEGC